MSVRCIIVDDEPNAVNLLEIFIRQTTQWQLLAKCYDALEALAFLKTQEVDVVFLDINMPIMNGFEFLEEMMMHERLSSIPVVMYTSSTYHVQQEKAKKLGASDFITKPSDMNLLKATLKTIFLANHWHY